MGMWNGEKKYFFCNVSVCLTSKVKVVRYFILLFISDHKGPYIKCVGGLGGGGAEGFTNFSKSVL